MGLLLAALQIYLKFREMNPENQLSQEVENIQNRLRERAADGILTNEEIMRSTHRDSDGDPKVRQDGSALHFDTAVYVVTSSFLGSSSAEGCYTFTVSTPLSSASTVTAAKIATDPQSAGC
ncbi:hypothetical protein ACFWN2_28755 [Lentzea sp. NPDC058436]|uniref:hypothetical protein n=1 Tax=Lentzea sp. NPDC058436 TaxID=3346499 RepID=UPI00364F54F5